MLFWWESIVAGAAATVAMTAAMRAGSAMGMTSMNMGLILGSMFKSDAAGAKRLGWVLHGMNGLVFGLAYGVVWWALDPSLDSAWWIGLLFGLLHGGIASAAMPMMSAMHPRVRPGAAAGEVVLPRFGFGGSGFGSMTPLGILAGHLVFGLVWGVVFQALA